MKDKKIIRDTNIILFNKTMELVKSDSSYKAITNILDYVLTETRDVRELSNYEFDVVARLTPGPNEGIYISCYIEGDFDGSQSNYLKLGTIKTLGTSLEAYKLMGELAGLITCYSHKYVNREISRYTA